MLMSVFNVLSIIRVILCVVSVPVRVCFRVCHMHGSRSLLIIFMTLLLLHHATDFKTATILNSQIIMKDIQWSILRIHLVVACTYVHQYYHSIPLSSSFLPIASIDF